MDKLELKHIGTYLPYGLQIHSVSDSFTINVKGIFVDNNGIKYISDFGEDYATYIWDVKPLLLPLSEINNHEVVTLISDRAQENYFTNRLPTITKWWMWADIQILIEKHFDVFGLIDAGLALNKNDYINPVDVLKDRKPFQDFPFDTK